MPTFISPLRTALNLAAGTEQSDSRPSKLTQLRQGLQEQRLSQSGKKMIAGSGFSAHPLNFQIRSNTTSIKKDGPFTVSKAINEQLQKKAFAQPGSIRDVLERMYQRKSNASEEFSVLAAKSESQSTTLPITGTIRTQLNARINRLKLKFPVGSSNFDGVGTTLIEHSKRSGENLSKELFYTFFAQKIISFIPGLAAQSTLAIAVKEHLAHFVNGITTAITQTKLSERDSLIRVYRAFKEEFADIDAQRSPKTKNAIFETDNAFEDAIYHDNDARLRELLAERMRMMSIPETSKDISDDATQEAVDAVVDKKKLPDVKQALEGMNVQITDNSTTASFKGRRAQAYIFGPAGTGKTTTVEEFAKAHRLPIIPIQLGEFVSNPYALENRLAEKIIESDTTNPIIIMDEAGLHLSKSPQLGNVLNSLFDPDNKILNYYGAEVDFSKVTILMMGNHELHEPALRSKLEQITIPYLVPYEKRKVLDGAVRDEIQILREKHYTEEQIGKITHEFDRNKELLLREDLRTPGGRVLKQVVAKVFQFLRVHERKRPNRQIDANELSMLIRKKYDNFISPDDTYQPPPSFMTHMRQLQQAAEFDHHEPTFDSAPLPPSPTGSIYFDALSDFPPLPQSTT